MRKELVLFYNRWRQFFSADDPSAQFYNRYLRYWRGKELDLFFLEGFFLSIGLSWKGKTLYI